MMLASVEIEGMSSWEEAEEFYSFRGAIFRSLLDNPLHGYVHPDSVQLLLH